MNKRIRMKAIITWDAVFAEDEIVAEATATQRMEEKIREDYSPLESVIIETTIEDTEDEVTYK